MNPSEAAVVLAKAAAFDNRTVTETAARAFAEALPDVPIQAALEAVADHYRESTEWLKPAHITARITARRRAGSDLLRLAGSPDFPSGLDLPGERRYRQAWVGHILDGLSRDEATAAADRDLGIVRAELVDRPMRQLIAGWSGRPS